MADNKSKSDQNKKADFSDQDKKLIHDHAWNHFQFVAKQRVDLFKYYIIFITIFFTGTSHLLLMDGIFSNAIGGILSAVFLMITIIFQRLEKRNNQLVNKSRLVLERFEADFKEFIGYSIFANKCMCDAECKHSQSYQMIFNLGYTISCLALLANTYIVVKFYLNLFYF